MSTPETPSADQLAAARLSLWHQDGAVAAGSQPGSQDDDPTPAISPALLTTEALRTWLATAGLVLFAPRPQHLPAPAPSLVEATLGVANSTPTLAETETARTLLAHLIADGSAVPLSLLGTPTGASGSNFGPDIPDFVVSSAVFPYIFTLRGDKTWKQPPSTSGASKVSPLSLNAYTLLLEHGTLSAYDLATQLGKEITETAVLRSLVELWSHLRVIPIPQADGRPTLWEPTTTRLTKQIKAGANAGQPTALSALISLYLGQSILATEDEIETFLSPLAPRSRIRDVVHALLGARELDTLAIDGRTVLHVAGELPSFLASDSGDDTSVSLPETGAPGSHLEQQLGPDGEPLRIKKFIAKPRKIGTGFVTKPVRKSLGAPDRERRPFSRDSDARPAFNKPWDEEGKQRSARRSPSPGRPASREADGPVDDIAAASSSAPSDAAAERTSPRKPSFGDRKPGFGDRKPGFGRGEGNRPAFGGSRPAFGSKPPFSGKPRFGQNSRPGGEAAPGDRSRPGSAARSGGFSARSGFSADRPDRPSSRDRDAGDSRPPRREFTPRFPRGSDSDERPAPGRSSGFDRKPGSYAGKPSSGDRPSFDRRPPFRDNAGPTRPPRREFGPPAGRDKPGTRTAPGAFDRPRKPFTPREEGDRPTRPAFRKFDAPRGPRPARPGQGGADATDRRSGGFDRSRPSSSERKPGSYSARPAGFPARPGASARPPGDSRPRKPFSGKPGGLSAKPGADKPFRKPGRFAGDAPGANTFDKFKGGKKPFGKRAPARKFKPDEGATPAESGS